MPPYSRRAPRPLRLRTSRRKVIWATALVNAPVTIAAAAVDREPDLLAGLEAGGVGIIGGTIMRTHVRLNLSFAANDTQPGVVWGLIVYPKIQSANIPSPGSFFYEDWMWHNYFVPGQLGPVASASTQIFASDNVDVKSRRRLHQMDDSLFLVVVNLGSQSVKMSYEIRTLIALP